MTVNPKVITKAVTALAKWEGAIRTADVEGARPLSQVALRKMADEMLTLRLALTDSDARETRPDPSVRRRAKTRKRT